MGFFDRFSSKKPPVPVGPGATAAAEPLNHQPAPVASTASAPGSISAGGAGTVAGGASAAGGVKPRLAAAREKMEALDLPAALAIYEEVIGSAGDRADVLVTISGDLGSHGHVAEIVELIAPRYAADRHGPATGLNLLQAYLAVRNADAAQHILDILFGLNRPELEDRLHGFSNAIAEILASPTAGAPEAGAPGDAAKIGLITISKPIWFYGLEALAPQILPPKEGRLRRISFAQLALPGRTETPAAAGALQPEDEMGRLSRGIPLWFAETFYFSPSYSPTAAIGLLTPPQGSSHYVTFGAEWSTENLRQLVETTDGGLDYIVAGALRSRAGDYELLLRVWEVKNFRERKTFTARWTPSTADEALSRLHEQIRAYMEWSPASATLVYTVPARPRPWIDTLGTALGLFLCEKGILPREQLGPVELELVRMAEHAAENEAMSLAFLTARARATKLGLSSPPEAPLARTSLVDAARAAVGDPSTTDGAG